MIALSAVVAGYEASMRLIDPGPVEHWAGSPPRASSASSATKSSRCTGSGSAAGSVRRRWWPTGCTPAPTASPRWRCCVGAGGVALGFPLADPIVGLLITVAILVVLRSAARDVFRRLMDGVDPELVDTAEAALASRPGVEAVRGVRMRWIGHRLHADAELEIDPGATLEARTSIAHDAEHELIDRVPKLSQARVHCSVSLNSNECRQYATSGYRLRDMGL